ncbi:MAG: hypothetical protein ACI82S_000285 [Patiriisocius sp.]|jgi:hypothetical protein
MSVKERVHNSKMSISDQKNDTRTRHSINTIETLQSLAKSAPFDTLAAYVESSYHQQDLNEKVIDDSVAGAINRRSITTLQNNADCLNQIITGLHDRPPICFTDYKEFENDSRYYEQIIYELNKVPTRRNWHDFFNGLIWSQFPNTKQYFNTRHIEQIQISGDAKKRTSVRDKLTHFDECGLVLFTNSFEVQAQLKEHEWTTLFVDNATKWHSSILPVIFGHALWEMLLDPFIGLTAKVTVIEVSNSIMTQLAASKDKRCLYATCDSLLLEHICKNQLMEAQRPWLPLPLLGIPNWSPIEQSDLFYSNKSYFMAKRK